MVAWDLRCERKTTVFRPQKLYRLTAFNLVAFRSAFCVWFSVHSPLSLSRTVPYPMPRRTFLANPR
jgi:hypothetical protein